MSLGRLIKYALTLPPHIAIQKSVRLVLRVASGYLKQILLPHRSTYVDIPAGAPNFVAALSPLDADAFDYSPLALAGLTDKYLQHRFDLLGSGWVEVRHGMVCKGFDGNVYAPALPSSIKDSALIRRLSPGNRKQASAIRQMIDDGYVPIDWQLDYKSGYRWSEGQASATITYGHEPGADVKVPWELARLQHLIQLALAFDAATVGKAGFIQAETYSREFQNQVLDFLAANPPGYGVNWVCTMDVAIRAANLLLVYDMFKARGAHFSEAFQAVFFAGVLAHGRHIAGHLEWNANLRANHYLSDIVGLLFVAAYLPRSPETDSWLAFAVRQLIAEVDLQFSADGANFEASTSYHRLAAEMVIFATALTLGLDEDKKQALSQYDHQHWLHHPPLPPAPVETHRLPGGGASPFPDWYIERLQRMAEFAMHVTKPNGDVAQVGDNDSGRFFKISPLVKGAGQQEQFLDFRHLVAAFAGIFERPDFTAFVGPDFTNEIAIIRALSGDRRLPGPRGGETVPHAINQHVQASDEVNPPEGFARHPLEIRLPDPKVLGGLETFAYPNFGYYLWRSERFFLAVRCGPVGQNGNGGHAHNDQLTIELNIDGEDWIADPGTFVYTPAPKWRNAYRSVQSHAAPRMGDRETERLDLGLFRLGNSADARCLVFNAKHFLGMHSGFGQPVYRSLEIGHDQITVTDWFNSNVQKGNPVVIVREPAELRKHLGIKIPFSPGYGIQIQNGENSSGEN